MENLPASQIAKHREMAKRARRFAEAVDDKQTVSAMNEVAKENDDDADRLEAEVENETRTFMSPR